MQDNHVDVAIVGGGPGGYTAALYCARAGLETLVLEKLSAGGQMATTSQVENYPGFDEGIDGFELAEKMQRGAQRFGARTLTMVGLALYTVGGAAAGLFNSIWAVLVMRALVGVGVGMIMPLSTGLLTYYFAPEKREGLMGLSSAANQLGSGEASVLPRSRRERGVFAVYALRTGQNNE